MRITERKDKRLIELFGDLNVGEVFRLAADEDERVYIKTNDGEANSVCLDDGDVCFTAAHDDCILLDAELIVSEVTE